jgi:hypothetical protein
MTADQLVGLVQERTGLSWNAKSNVIFLDKEDCKYNKKKKKKVLSNAYPDTSKIPTVTPRCHLAPDLWNYDGFSS